MHGADSPIDRMLHLLEKLLDADMPSREEIQQIQVLYRGVFCCLTCLDHHSSFLNLILNMGHHLDKGPAETLTDHDVCTADLAPGSTILKVRFKAADALLC